MKGSFETAKRKDGKGMCLKQISPKEGILWGGAGGDLPHTIFGDHNWTDYTIQADVLVTAGKAAIGGRYWCGEQRGVGLVLQQDGTWWIEASVEAVEVVDGKENKLKVPPLATGKINGFIPATWHHLTLVLKGDELTASIDGKEMARVRYEKFYPAHKSGRAYLMSSYDPNCFDNVSVKP